MTKRSLKTTVIALTVVTALAAAAGCTSGSKDSAPKAKMAGDKVIMTVMSPADADTNMDTNLVSDKFKIQFQWQTTTFDAGAAKEKRQIALASGDYPDLFFLIPWIDAFTKAEVRKLGQQGVAVPLEDLIKDNAPNIQK